MSDGWWTTRDGRRLRLSEMTTQHLANCWSMLWRQWERVVRNWEVALRRSRRLRRAWERAIWREDARALYRLERSIRRKMDEIGAEGAQQLIRIARSVESNS